MSPRKLWLRLAVACVLAGASLFNRALADAPAPPSVDHLRRTDVGTPYLEPAGWRLHTEHGIAVLTAPELGSRMAIVELGDAKDADAAVAAAWRQFRRDAAAPKAEKSEDQPVRFGWAQVRKYRYADVDEPERLLRVDALRGEKAWVVLLFDVAAPILDRRESQITRFIASVRAPGYQPPSLVGRRVRNLGDADIERLVEFLDQARVQLDVPGIALGIVQGDTVKFAGGLGVREVGKPEAVDQSTLFLTASITKPLTSLLLAKLVDTGALRWDTPAHAALPELAVGDAALTKQLQIRHLLCACSGIPARDMEWIFSGEQMAAADVLAVLKDTSPTAGIGQLYQYSNLMAAVGGMLGGRVAEPDLPIDRAYDVAMQRLVFNPLGMQATTFDFAAAQKRPHARPHGTTLDGKTVAIPMDFNEVGQPMRADGGAWSNVHDLLRYLRMELAHGKLPNGRRYIGRGALQERLVPQVARGGLDQWYTMGLKTDRQLGILQVRHGGSMAGYQGEIFWLPEHDAGFVLLLNADAGEHLRTPFARRFLETLFDTDLGAAEEIAALPALLKSEREASRAELQSPVPTTIQDRLAVRYVHPTLGAIDVEQRDGAVWLDFGGWDTEVAAVTDAAGHSFVESVSPGVAGYRFEVTRADDREALVLDDGQRTYTFVAGAGKATGDAP